MNTRNIVEIGTGSESCGADCADVIDEDKRYRLHRRFDRLGRLYGDGAVERLMAARVAVFGLGGVGSFAAEALARSAVGHLMLVDFDEVCSTNINRHLQALQSTVGQPKAEVLGERLRSVNPEAKVIASQAFYKAESSDELLTDPWGSGYDFVVDCIDNMAAKAHLLATCKSRGILVISSMGAAGKRDPAQIRVADLGQVQVCPMSRALRRILRKHHGFPEGKTFGIPAVHSLEPRLWPRELTYDKGQGFRCVCPHKSDEHSCASRNLIDGTAVFVTGAFGLSLAAHVVNALVGDLLETNPPARDRHGYRGPDAEGEASSDFADDVAVGSDSE
ncbi:MAG: hypothetical protein A2341_05680 [Deltaproteobacteria bacterium RIFOXYB12_FULL_58_9]|nr:MAG: hypothetical protein A2341_05680 [Deltaproteobacteria bacterium RIFOXYB12_FULL_58_9]